MPTNTMSTLVGRFLASAAVVNGFEHQRAKKFLDRVLGPDAWYVARFRDPTTGISSSYGRWRNFMAVDDYLDSVRIEHHGRVVYRANINRYDRNDHINQAFDHDPEWQRALADLAQRYSSAYR